MSYVANIAQDSPREGIEDSSSSIPPDTSTLTDKERSIFKRLFGSGQAPVSQPTAYSLDGQEGFSGPETEGKTADMTLEAIFDEALHKERTFGNVHTRRKTGLASNQETGSSSNHSAPHFFAVKHAKLSRDAASPSTLDEPATVVAQSRPASEQEMAIAAATRDSTRRLEGLFARTVTDSGMWRLLDLEVFSKMREVNEYLEKETKAQEEAAAAATAAESAPKRKKEVRDVEKKCEKPKAADLKDQEDSSQKRRERSGKGKTHVAEPSLSETRTSEESHSGQPSSESLTSDQPSTQKPFTDPAQSGQQTFPSSLTTVPALSSASPSLHPLQLLVPIYGPALLYAARLFRTIFPRSPYALALLPTIKSLGAISYVLGASTALYNEILYLKWTQYRDLHGCADLVEEMTARGLTADARTAAVLRDAGKVRRREKTWQMPLHTAPEKRLRPGPERGTGTETSLAWPRAERAGQGEAAAMVEAADRINKGGLVTAGTQGRSSATQRASSNLAVPHYSGRMQGIRVTSVAAGWWRMQATRAGWERWKIAQAEAVRRREEELRRISEVRMALDAEKAAAALESGESEKNLEPEITVLDQAVEEGEEEERMTVAAGGSG